MAPALPLPPERAKRHIWEKPLAITGIALGFFPYVIPGFFALRSYTRWREGKIGKPLFAWIWGGIMAVVLVLGGIAAYNALHDRVLVANDFNDGTGDFSADSDNFVTLEYVDGGYRFLIKDPSLPQSSRNFDTSGSVPGLSFEADVTERVGPTSEDEVLGLWCLSSRTTGYLFVVAANGDYAIVKHFDTNTNQATTLTTGTNSSASRRLGQTQHLRIECSAGGGGAAAVTGSINGTVVADALDPEGYDSFNGIGLFVATSEAGTDVLWDDVVARSLSPEDAHQPDGSSSATIAPTLTASVSDTFETGGFPSTAHSFTFPTIVDEDFTDGPGGFTADGGSSILADDGRLGLRLDGSGRAASWYRFRPAVVALTMEADVVRDSGPASGEIHGLGCYASAATGYLVGIAPEGTFEIAKVTDESSNSVRSLSSGKLADFDPSAPQHLRLDCRGGGDLPTEISFFVGGVRVAMARDPNGYDSFEAVSLSVETAGASAEVAFDNLVVEQR